MNLSFNAKDIMANFTIFTAKQTFPLPFGIRTRTGCNTRIVATPSKYMKSTFPYNSKINLSKEENLYTLMILELHRCVEQLKP